MVLVVVQRVVLGFWPCDDAFIAFRFAYNLAQHGQLAFNVGDPIFGCTTLSYALAMAALNVLGVPVPMASWALTLLADMMVCLLLTTLAARQYRHPALGILATVLWLTHPIIGLNAVSGMETSIFVALMLGFVLACGTSRFGLGLVLIAVMVWTRIDGVIAAPVWIFAWWRAGRPWPRASGIVITGVLAALYLGFTWTSYGTFIPQSAVAKASNDTRSLMAMLMLIGSFAGALGGVLSIWYWYVSPHVLLLAGLGRLLWRRRFAHETERLLVLTALCHAGMFVLAGRATAMLFPWYYVPFLTLILLPSLYATLELLVDWRDHPPRLLQPVTRITMGLMAVGGGALVYLLETLRDQKPAHVSRWMNHVFLDNPDRFERFTRAVETDTLLLIAYLLMAVAGLALARRGLGVGLETGGRPSPWTAALVAGAMVLLLVAPLTLNRADIVEKYQRREEAYLELGRWISVHVGRGELIGAQEIGAAGWGALEHPFYDELALITPAALGASRAQWVSKLKPAVIIDTSTTRGRPLDPGEAPPGYEAMVVGHNLVIFRKDIKALWDLDPAALQ